MSRRLELWLARMYTDEAFRDRLLSAPDELLAESDLTPAERAGLREIDRIGLRMHAQTLQPKRASARLMARPKLRDHVRAFLQRCKRRG